MASCALVLSTRAGADALPFGQIEDLVGPCLHRELYSASANRPQSFPFSWAEGSNCRIMRYCQLSCSPRQQPLKTSCNPSHALPSCRESIGKSLSTSEKCSSKYCLPNMVIGMPDDGLMQLFQY